MHALHGWLSELRERAALAAGRPAPFGPDLDPAAYASEAHGAPGDERAGRDAALGVGVDLDDATCAGTFLQVDRSVVARRVAGRLRGRVELVPADEAALELPWVADAWWRLVAPDADRYTAAVALRPGGGYCLRVLPGVHVEEPLQACLLLAETASAQSLHNVVHVEAGASAHLVTGCAVHRAATGLHLGVTEVVVGPGATLTATMIHRWAPGVHARPRSTVIVEEGGTYVSNYVLLGEVGSLQMFPRVVLRGRGARARFQAVLCGRGASLIDVGSLAVHEGEESASEAVSRTIALEEARVWVRGRLVARADRCRARLECRGMLVSARAAIVAIPELEADGAPHAELAHEAAISPVAEEEVAYLMARGFAREEAVSAITRGFLDAGIAGLAPALARAVDEVLAATPAGGGL